ncbi:MAG: lysophospholipid acyltransferase family protein [Ignavibacteriaceae bacterium]|nr:lysophospholipid acyltransferase family protein [Ignavibacteriaceae bacterium]
MKNKLEYFLFHSLSKFFCLLGIDHSRKFAFPLALLFYYFIPIRKKVVKKNLSLAFPNLSKEKISNTAFECFKSLAITLIELLCIPILKKSDIEKYFNWENISLLEKKYSENKGVILLISHSANWEYATLAISQKMGFPFGVIMKEQRNTLVSDWMVKYRSKWGNRMITLGISVRNFYKELLDKHIVLLAADQRASKESQRVLFFGRLSTCFSGPASLALKTGAPIIFALMKREKNLSYTIRFEEVSLENLPISEEEKLLEISQRHTIILEEAIRTAPEQWLWMHDRWKF